MSPTTKSITIGLTLGLLLILAFAVLTNVFGCATTKDVLAKCAPPSDTLVDVVLGDLQAADYEAALAADLVEVTKCVAREAVARAVAAARTAKFAGTVDSASIVARGNAWLAAHPGS